MHRGISALTLSTKDMANAVAFYESLGFRLDFIAGDKSFATLWAGPTALNLTTEPGTFGFWGRAIFEVSDVDTFHDRCKEAGHQADFAPRDAPLLERYFHIRDPDGHELSFMTPLPGKTYPGQKNENT
ncbi:VOC family protein [Henriciella marina]|uniref:VOC family protein n=1 Tax=Henriciella marina TaxID=453851 RepID=UPI000361CDF6|nr:VOC family protein [Henriciella marina]